jgi:ABC-type Fe3+/spermidine/putrescine transport system ATPase subunit
VTAADFLHVENLVKEFGAVRAVDDVSFSLRQGAFLTLLGPSGCGKTTTLRSIAGFERVDGGRIAIDGAMVSDATAGVHVAPEKRNFGMVFQSYAVWPHMTVAENVAYGLQRLKLSRAETAERVKKVLALVGLEGRDDRPATMLSGGQQQRVALARAIVYQPNILLFDEPLSNLDAKLRERMRIELRRLQAEVGITSVYVTHDQEEAMVVSDQVIVMHQGRVQQIGPPTEIYDNPANRFVADFIGAANIIEGRLAGAEAAGGAVSVDLDLGAARTQVRGVARNGVTGHDAAVVICVRPEAIRLNDAAAAARADDNVITGRVTRRINMGNHIDYRIAAGPHEMKVRTDRASDFGEGASVNLVFPRAACLCLSA